MSDIWDVISRHNATFAIEKRRFGLLISLIIAIGLALLCRRPGNDFLTGALSAQAILVGFSFNVLFYLVANRLTRPAIFSSIEHELRFDRLSKLSDEVFDSVSYFSLVATASLTVALLLLIINSDGVAENALGAMNISVGGYHLKMLTITVTSYVFLAVVSATLYFLLIESLCTFLRTVERVRFYFSMLKTMHDGASG